MRTNIGWEWEGSWGGNESEHGKGCLTVCESMSSKVATRNAALYKMLFTVEPPYSGSRGTNHLYQLFMDFYYCHYSESINPFIWSRNHLYFWQNCVTDRSGRAGHNCSLTHITEVTVSWNRVVLEEICAPIELSLPN